MWITDLQTQQHTTIQNECVEEAYELHDFWYGKNMFPMLWSLIDFDKEKLASIFVFFCETLAIQSTLAKQEENEEGKRVSDILSQRLSSRWKDKEDPIGPDQIPMDKKKQIESVSKDLMAAFYRLEENELIGPAFELFSSGTLTIKHHYMTNDNLNNLRQDELNNLLEGELKNLKEDESIDKKYPVPDSGGFFYWAEFALLAALCGFDEDSWIKVLPVLLRSERIFALCFGQPENGRIPPYRKFSEYGNLRFTRIHPRVAQGIMPTRSTSLDQLDAEQTTCAKFAFPGEDWPDVDS